MKVPECVYLTSAFVWKSYLFYPVLFDLGQKPNNELQVINALDMFSIPDVAILAETNVTITVALTKGNIAIIAIATASATFVFKQCY